MLAKFNQNIQNYRYILGVDLAMYRTGVCLYDMEMQNFCELEELVVDKNSQEHYRDLYDLLNGFLHKITSKYPSQILVIKEACPAQQGSFTSISTLQALSGAHAILDVCVSLYDTLDYYDTIGVSPVTVKALFRSSDILKPQKEDVAQKLAEIFGFSLANLTDNITDAMGVVYALLNKKWNADINAEIKELEKEIKKLKAQKAINSRMQRIAELQKFKILQHQGGSSA